METCMKLQLASTLALALIAASAPAGAEIYRSVDAQGRVHYSDRPSAGAQKVAGLASRPTDTAAVAQRAQTESEQRAKAAADTRKQQTTEAASKTVTQDMAKLQAARCKKAQEDYKVAIESQRLYRMGP